jgi:hypothetical protein
VNVQTQSDIQSNPSPSGESQEKMKQGQEAYNVFQAFMNDQLRGDRSAEAYWPPDQAFNHAQNFVQLDSYRLSEDIPLAMSYKGALEGESYWSWGIRFFADGCVRNGMRYKDRGFMAILNRNASGRWLFQLLQDDNGSDVMTYGADRNPVMESRGEMQFRIQSQASSNYNWSLLRQNQ